MQGTQAQKYSLVFYNSFYYCPKCMKNVDHMLYHQFSFWDKCLIHNKRLVDTCPVCNSKLDYEIDIKIEEKTVGQQQMVALFSNINNQQVRLKGRREVNWSNLFINLDMIISLVYRVMH